MIPKKYNGVMVEDYYDHEKDDAPDVDIDD